jgi:RNA polymerase sigma-70 factor (sigma-E family)
MIRNTMGHAASFEGFYASTWEDVFRTAFLICGDREEARDLTQEAFVRAAERWKAVERMERPEAWMQRVVANLALSWRRRLRHARRYEQSLRPGVISGEDGTVAAVVQTLRSLPPAQRVVVVLRYYADLSIEDTARAVGKRTATVRSLSSQGLTRLRAALQEQEVHDG